MSILCSSDLFVSKLWMISVKWSLFAIGNEMFVVAVVVVSPPDETGPIKVGLRDCWPSFGQVWPGLAGGRWSAASDPIRGDT